MHTSSKAKPDFHLLDRKFPLFNKRRTGHLQTLILDKLQVLLLKRTGMSLFFTEATERGDKGNIYKLSYFISLLKNSIHSKKDKNV
jgi:hypothetical protein